MDLAEAPLSDALGWLVLAHQAALLLEVLEVVLALLPLQVVVALTFLDQSAGRSSVDEIPAESVTCNGSQRHRWPCHQNVVELICCGHAYYSSRPLSQSHVDRGGQQPRPHNRASKLECLSTHRVLTTLLTELQSATACNMPQASISATAVATSSDAVAAATTASMVFLLLY